MSTPEQPLTRKKLRELHATGSVPVQGEAASPDAEIDEDTYVGSTPAASAPAPTPSVPLARAATPAFTPPAPMPDAHVDLGVSPLTRRQAREQERIRTASVPVITPDVIAAQMPVSALGEATAPRYAPFSAPATAAPAAGAPAAGAITVPEKTDVDEKAADAEESDQHARGIDEAPAATVDPGFGAHLLKDDEVSATLPASFDELIVRNASPTGAIGASNALILSQTPDMPPLSGPVNATGEVLITGTFHLPEGLGSAGGDPRSTDGKEVDAVLVDGELPPASSPTPIAASAAISTVRGTGEIIRPPAPEKGGRLLFSLAITAGVLALALVGVLILAFVNGAL